ncbi:MAG TPA: hypothetical protein VMV03_00950 [Spirochaetia bacterium]|nr:hypothetical protein [Spirochaetia bacterium]
MLDTLLPRFLNDDELIDRVFGYEANMGVSVEIAHMSPLIKDFERVLFFLPILLEG